VGGWTVGSTTDDVDYLSSLIDWAYNEYKIDRDRVYSTGMSNGGFMSYHLACNLSSKIAAVASVTGSMTPQTYNGCSPSHPTAILQIHGTADGVVPYYGNSISRAIPAVMDYWDEYNDCDQESVSQIDDVNGDGFGGLFYLYNQCLGDVNVRLFLMTNMGHEWPTNNGQNDIIAANEIWYFLKQYDVNGKIIP
jgi:polyhydroxybutyrate depolymerase